MKTNQFRYTAMALFGGAMLVTANAEKVRFEQLPTEIRDKIRVHSGAAAIEDIDRQTKGGKTTYEVAFKKNGQHTELIFDEKGQLMNADGSTAALASGKTNYKELPDAVRKAADARLKGAEVNDVDRQVKNGQVTYEIGFKQNGQQQELVVSQDGRIMHDATVPQTAVGAPATSVSGRSESGRIQPRDATLAEPVMLSASEKVKLEQLPERVQKAITTSANGARIEDVERGIWQGQNIYQAAFKENGKHIEVQVRENGMVLHDPRTPSGRGVLSRGSSSEYASVTALVPLSSGEKVKRESLPRTVERRLRTHIGSRPIDDIERGTWQGKTIYQIAFKDDAAQHVELQVDEKGNIVYDPRAKR
jgi:uncharacterized membrane protein YkoI